MSSASIERPVIVWLRRDLRLADNSALNAAARSGAPIIPVFVLDEVGPERLHGGASLWWLDKSLAALARDLEALGSRLVLRRGEAAVEIRRLASEVHARGVYWNRFYEPAAMARDDVLAEDLRTLGMEVCAFDGALLVEPWTVHTGGGGPYKVFTPFWKAARNVMPTVEMAPAPDRLAGPSRWPNSETLADWKLHPVRPDWSRGFDLWSPGETGAQSRLDGFARTALPHYSVGRDAPGVETTSRLSAHLHWGEIGPRQILRAIEAKAHADPQASPEAAKFLSELGWREFNHHVLFYNPELATENFRSSFDAFPWRRDPEGFAAWSRGLTGYPIVDAGMRELWATGFMHNRVRMIVASFLVKHLLIDWRQGEAWFWDTLVDANLANNAANWQWVAGSGADAAPYFRIFNPMAQGERFDREGAYVRRWIPELASLPNAVVHQPWHASPPPRGYPPPLVDHAQARARALEAYRTMRSAAVADGD